MPEGASSRDELLRRWAHVLFDQYGADVLRHVEERGRACALRGDRAGVAEWHDVGKIIDDLVEARRRAGEDVDARPPRDHVFREDVPPVSREWAFWVILSALALALVIMALLFRHF
ncbi:hypothetical protein [Sphingomonas colocasiae]|uniref:Uncharacterized protein n=1 Tax=Sphingomonas colocasiae TaxID=1848973 RepID=A0ABS7PHQ5_9SPHN|nr:hypothetical protein [Sphingomonas colocasiae]MBY8820831.1 hypothetical protein [Sphingomonas colocasiae]